MVANNLVQQASSFRSNRGKFYILEKMDVPVCQTGYFGFWLMLSAKICYAEPDSAKSDGPVLETRGSKIFRNSDDLSETMMDDPDDWRTPLIRYLENSGHITDRKVQWQALKYVVLENAFYHQTIDDLLLKCLGSHQSKIAMGEVHEGICGIHRSAHKIK
jgi:hypothetical protein